jgi:proteasome accessory factor C
MPETAPAQVARLVHLVAWMSQGDSHKPVSYRAAATHLGVSEARLRDDLDTLVRLSDDYKPWLSSLSVALTRDGCFVASQGQFRRPFRLTADETLALVVGLAGERGGRELAAKLGAAFARSTAVERAPATIGLGPTPGEHLEEVLRLAREALGEHRKLEIHYCGSGRGPGLRVVCPHQIVQRQMWWYVIAWCEQANGFRHFRADRILAATLLDARFTPRADFVALTRAAEVFRARETVAATVAFGPRIARWLEEQHPGGRTDPRGRYVVTFRVADPAWFVREVLQYGAEAEVLEPPELREAIRMVVPA